MLKWYRFSKSQVCLVSGTGPLWQSGCLVFAWERIMDPRQSVSVHTDHPAVAFKSLYPLKYQSAIPDTAEASGFVEGHFFASAAHGVSLVFSPLSSPLEQAWRSSSSETVLALFQIRGGILLPNHRSFSCLDMPQCSGETFPNSCWKSSCQTKAAGYLTAYTDVPSLLLALCNTLSCVVWQ